MARCISKPKNKNKDKLDTSKQNWFEFLPYGPVPRGRAYHSTCIIGNNMYIYGGEDLGGSIFDNLWMLNLNFIERNFNSRMMPEYPTEEDRQKAMA